LNKADEALSRKVMRFEILFQVLGLLPIIHGNQELVWGMLLFSL